jgi:hypothetical protein
MPSFDVTPERITVFPHDEDYLFKHYFERTDIFESLKEYYNHDKYRFEVPADEFETVREQLADNYYDLVVVDDLAPYCVVKETYTPHADILRASAIHWSRDGYNFFVLKDETAVAQAVEQGATPIDETDLVLGV